MEIDEEDFDKIKDLNLTINHDSNPNTKYCKSVVYKHPSTYVKTLHIHRIIMGLGDYKDDKRIVNHIDGNGLNNKKENLEISNPMHNSQSFRCINKNIGCIYKEKNTEKCKRTKQWMFRIVINKIKHQKRFLTEQEAIDYRDNYVKPYLQV